GSEQRNDSLLVIILGLRFDVRVGLQPGPINLQRIAESHLTTCPLNGQLVLRGLSVFFLLVGEAKLGDRQDVCFEALANQFPADANTAEIGPAWIVANQVCVRSLLPELEFIAVDLCL